MVDKKDVTDLVYFGLNDDESLPLTKCVCGKTFSMWIFVLTTDPEIGMECPNCGRRLYFTVSIKVFEIEPDQRMAK